MSVIKHYVVFTVIIVQLMVDLKIIYLTQELIYIKLFTQQYLILMENLQK